MQIYGKFFDIQSIEANLLLLPMRNRVVKQVNFTCRIIFKRKNHTSKFYTKLIINIIKLIYSKNDVLSIRKSVEFFFW